MFGKPKKTAKTDKKEEVKYFWTRQKVMEDEIEEENVCIYVPKEIEENECIYLPKEPIFVPALKDKKGEENVPKEGEDESTEEDASSIASSKILSDGGGAYSVKDREKCLKALPPNYKMFRLDEAKNINEMLTPRGTVICTNRRQRSMPPGQETGSKEETSKYGVHGPPRRRARSPYLEPPAGLRVEGIKMKKMRDLQKEISMTRKSRSTERNWAPSRSQARASASPSTSTMPL